MSEVFFQALRYIRQLTAEQSYRYIVGKTAAKTAAVKKN
jgi:hypothetical protein